MSDSEAIRASLQRKIEGIFAKVQTAISTLEDEQWRTVVFSDSGWTVADLLRHMISVEEIIQSYIEQIISGGGGAEVDFNLDEWNAETVQAMQKHAPTALLPMFAEAHQNSLALLERTPGDAWDKQGFYPHELIGTIGLKGWFKMIAVHNRIHLKDIQKVLQND